MAESPDDSKDPGKGSIARTDATGEALDPTFLRWQTSLPIDRRLIAEDVRGSVAHVEGLVAARLITRQEGEKLARGLEDIGIAVEAGKLELPLEEDVHMAVEVALRERIGEVADKLHTGRSRNDQVATDLKLWCRGAVAKLDSGVERVLEAVKQWSATHGETPMPAYTHRQVAIPVLASTWVGAALREPLTRDCMLLEVVKAELAESPLGGGAIAGNTLPIDATVAAEALGFTKPPHNPMDAVGNRDHAMTLAFACARICGHIQRFCADVVELASDGLLKLSGAIACGSSMMPHKRNPDLFELARGEAALRYGELVSLITLFQGLGTGYHRDLQHDKAVLFRAVDGTAGVLDMIALSLQHFELREDRCLEVLRAGDSVATDLTEHLVINGVPFRQAYRHVGSLVAKQRARGKRLVDLTAADLTDANLPLSLLDHLDPGDSARRRARRFDG